MKKQNKNDIKTQNQSSLLLKNSLRIFWKSKVLVCQLMLLLLIGVTVLVTIIFSNYSLNDSKNYYINNGNLSQLTVTIPEELRIISEDSENNTGLENQPGYTEIDKELQNKLDELGVAYSMTTTFNTSDILTGNSFLAINSLNEFDSYKSGDVNNLVLDEGSNELPKVNIDNSEIKKYGIIFNTYFRKIADKSYQNKDDTYQLFQYETYIQNEPWTLINDLVHNGIWHVNHEESLDYLQNLIPLASKPKDKTYYDQFINPFENNTKGKQNKNSYWYKMSKQIKMKGFVYNGFGFGVDFLKQKGGTVQMPFTVEIVDPSSYYSIASTNFMNANKGKKSFIPKCTFDDLINSGIPLKAYPTLEETPTYYSITNPDTGKKEEYSDLTSWIRDLDSKYKIQSNSIDYTLIGSGMRPDILYPVLDDKQLLVNSENSAVLFTNIAGLKRMMQGASSNSDVYYSVRTDDDKVDEVLRDLQDYTLKEYGSITSYLLDDSNQPNHVIYLRANFLNKLQNLIFVITIIIACIVGSLSIFFISTLLKSIVKQNTIVLGICLANGINKNSLILSFFNFALIPSLICGVLGYLIGVFLVSPMNGIYSAYWTLNIPTTEFNWWLFIAIPLIIFVILFICNYVVMHLSLKKNAIANINISNEFKVNWFILSTKWLTSKMPILSSLKFSFAFSNFLRLFILTFSVFSFISILTVSVGTLNEFQEALTITNNNKKYSFAFELYTPTIGGGYYSSMPYDQIGVSQMGLYNNYTSVGPGGGNYQTPNEVSKGTNYGSKYSTALKHPYMKEEKYFTSLLLPNDRMASEFDNSVVFFDNKLFTRLTADFNIQVLAQKINPWDMAKKILPKTLITLADHYFQKSVQINFEFYYWLQTANNYASQNGVSKIPSQYLIDGKPIKYNDYLCYISKQPFTIDGSDISSEYNPTTDSKKWIFIKTQNPETGKLEWVINEKVIMPGSAGLNLEMKVPAVQLLVLMLTNEKNDLYKKWYWNIYVKDKPELQNLGYMKSYDYRLAIGAVPVEENDETYTYLDSDIVSINDKKLKTKIKSKIYGIKPNSEYVYLYDKNNEDLKNKLQILENGNYPLVINEVVQKKYNIGIGDILNIYSKNTFDRYNLQNVGKDPGIYSNFEVVGITKSKSEEQFYTTQEIANNIIGFETFNNPDQVWDGMWKPGYGYIPFNGVFTNQQEPKLAFNYAGIYSPSGLSITHGAWNTNIGSKPGQISYSSQVAAIKNNMKFINDVTRINKFVDRNKENQIFDGQDFLNPIVVDPNNTSDDATGDVIRKIVSIYDSTTPIVASMKSLDSPMINKLIGPQIDGTILNVETVILVTILPTLLIIIMLIATMIIVEVRKLIVMLKVQGYSNWTSMMSFMFVYGIVLVLGLALSIPFTFGILSLLKSIVFTMFNIIISPIAPVWIYVAAIGLIISIFAIIFAYIFVKVKRLNLAQEISIR